MVILAEMISTFRGRDWIRRRREEISIERINVDLKIAKKEEANNGARRQN